MNLMKKINDFLIYWYLRYLNATENNVVEPIHLVFFILFGSFCYLTYNIMNTIALRNAPPSMEHLF